METTAVKYFYNSSQGVGSVSELALLIEKDMQYKGLVPGDRYLFTEAVAEQFNVNKMLAHRAMRLLADRKILVRQQRNGTFVGSAFSPLYPRESEELKSVHIMISIDYHRSSGLKEGVLVDAAMSVLPNAGVHLHYVPEKDPLSYIKNIVHQAELTGNKEGFIFIRSTFEVQQYVQESGILAVVFGSVYTGIDKLSWLDVDQSQIGRLMAQYAVAKNAKSFAVFMYNTWRHGDSIFFNSITQNLGKMGLNMNSLDIYNIGRDSDIANYIKHIAAVKVKPVAIFCRTDSFAEEALLAGEKEGLKIGEDIIVICGGYAKEGNQKKYPHIKSKVSIGKQAEQMVGILKHLSEEKILEPMQITIPAELMDVGFDE